MESLGGRESRRKTLYTMRKEGGERNITPHDKKARKEKKNRIGWENFGRKTM